jgi:recombination protein RecR
MSLPKEIQNLGELFSSLPGIGPKLSNKIALYMAVSNRKLASSIDLAIQSALNNIVKCEICRNVSTDGVCEICEDTNRDDSIVMIVENSLDLYAIEETGDFSGKYHVLEGVISPVNGIGPDDLSIDLLLSRVKEGKIKELIFGLNPNLEGDSTTLYIKNELENLNLDVQTSVLAKGIPTGSNIEFMSSQTLSDSLKSRKSL